MKRVQQFMVAMMAMLVCIVFVRVARAEAPAGGYALVPTKSGEATVIEIGPGLYWPKVYADFNAGYKRATGKDLTIEDVQALNEAATFPVCQNRNPQWIPRGKGLTGGDVVRWKDCPQEKRALGFVAGRQLVIPMKKPETADDRFAHEAKILASWNSPAALSARIAELGGTAPAVAPTSEPTASASPTANQPSTAPPSKMPTTSANAAPAAPTHESWAHRHPVAINVIMLAIGFALAALLFGASRGGDEEEQKKLREQIDERDARLSRLIASHAMEVNGIAKWFGLDPEKVSAKDVFKGIHDKIRAFANSFGLPTDEEMTYGEISVAIATESNRRVQKKADANAQLRGEMAANEKSAMERIAAVQAAAAQAAAEAMARTNAIQKELQNQLDMTRAEEARVAGLRRELASVEAQLDPLHKQLITLDDKRTVLRRDIGVLRIEFAATVEGTEAYQVAGRKLAAAIAEVQEIGIPRTQILDEAKPLEEKRGEILQALTGRSDKVLALYKEAQHDRNDAAEDRGKASAELAEADRLTREAEALHATATTTAEQNEARSRDLDDREGRVTFQENMVQLLMKDVTHLLNGALRFLGYDPAKVSHKDIMEMGGAEGLYLKVLKKHRKTAKFVRSVLASLRRVTAERDALLPFEAKFVSAQEQIIEMGRAHDVVREENASLQARIVEMGAEAVHMQRDYKALQVRTEELNGLANATRQERDELRLEVADLRTSGRQTALPTPDSFDQREHEFTLREQGLQERIAELNAEIMRLRGLMDVDGQVARIAELEARLEGLAAQLEHGEDLLRQAEAVIGERDGMIGNLEGNISRLEATAAERERVLSQQRQERDQLVADKALLGDKLGEADRAYSELIASMREAGSHIRLSSSHPVIERTTRTSHPTDQDLLPPDSNRSFEELLAPVLAHPGKSLFVDSFEMSQRLLRLLRMPVRFGPALMEKIPELRKTPEHVEELKRLPFWKFAATFRVFGLEAFLPPSEGGTERPPALAGE